jgi:hypothetical protein
MLLIGDFKMAATFKRYGNSIHLDTETTSTPVIKCVYESAVFAATIREALNQFCAKNNITTEDICKELGLKD